MGYGVVPEALVRPICDRKANEDFGSAHLNQRLLAAVLESGRYESHVQQVRAFYRLKRDRMLAAARQYMGDLPGVSWVRPEGGLYVWMTLPSGVQTGFDSPLFQRAAKVDGVMYVPGELSYGGPPAVRCRNQMRLSFGVETDRIEEGMPASPPPSKPFYRRRHVFAFRPGPRLSIIESAGEANFLWADSSPPPE